MLRNILELNPFFQTDDSNAGKTAEEIAAETAAQAEAASKIAAEPDEYAQMQATLDANRDAILSLDRDEAEPGKTEEENKEANKTQTPEELAAIEAGKMADKITTVNEDFINDYEKAAEYFGFDKLDKAKVKEALNALKGRNLDNHVLKSFVHTQVKLQEYKEKDKADPDRVKSKEEILADDNIDDSVKSKYSDRELNTKDLTEEETTSIKTAKAAALFNILKPKYKDLTAEDVADEEAINDYIATVAINKPLLADDFKADFRKANSLITRETNEYVDRAKNWRVYLKEDAQTEIEKFGKNVTAKGIPITQLSDSLTETYIINNILKDKAGKIRGDIVKNYKDSDGIFILDKEKFQSALVEHFDPRITELTKKAGANEFLEKKKLKDPNPSISSTDIKGEAMKREDVIKKGVIPDDPAFDYESMQKVLEQNRKAIVDANGNPYTN